VFLYILNFFKFQFSPKNGLPTIPSIDDPDSKIEPVMSKKRSRIISFGYASTAHHFRHRRRVSKNLEEGELEEASTSSSTVEDGKSSLYNPF
jgi:hypothetical protein